MDDQRVRTWMPLHPKAWDGLTDDERADILQVFVLRVDAAGDVEFLLRQDRGFSGKAGISGNAAAAAIKALGKLQATRVLVRSETHGGERVPIPTPPDSGALRLLHLHEQGWSFDQLAADDSPMLAYLTRSTDDDRFDSRKQTAWRIVRDKVEPFREAAPRWWFDLCLAAAVTDWADASARPPKKQTA